MGVKKKPTLKILFRQFAISLIVMLVAAIIVPSGLEGLAIKCWISYKSKSK
jgi:signal transduction histidine kinase